MKLIVSPLGELARYVSRQHYHLLDTLIRDHGWVNVELDELEGEAGPLSRRFERRFGTIPEAFLFWESYELLDAHWEEWARLGSRLGVLADDLHKEERGPAMRRSFDLCDIIFTTYANVFEEFFPGIDSAKIEWSPHSASPDFHLKFNETARNTILLSGAINDYYPMRQRLMSLHSRNPAGIHLHPHPGYHCEYVYDGSNPTIGGGYAATIRSHRAAFTDGSKLGYIVAKHFEIPATGALLLADQATSPGLRQLGFIQDTHYLAASADNLEDCVQDLLDEENHPHLDQIRRRGQALVMERHKTSDRALSIDARFAGTSASRAWLP